VFNVYVLCSVACRRVFFPVGQSFFSYFCAPRILPRMRNTLGGSPAFSANEDNLAQTPATGATPPTHVGARTPAATCPVPSALQTPAAGLTNAGDWPLTCSRLPFPPRPPLTQSRRRPYRRRRQPSPPNCRRRPYKRRRQHTRSPSHLTRGPPVSQTPAAK